MSRKGILTWYFAVVLVRGENDKFLLVHERKHGQLWYLPAGRVEPGETLEDGARREALEETGLHVRLTGLLKLQHSPGRDGMARVRAVYLAEPVDADAPPKALPGDEHTLEARWCSLEEAEKLPLRGGEVTEMMRAVLGGAPSYPLEVVGDEQSGI